MDLIILFGLNILMECGQTTMLVQLFLNTAVAEAKQIFSGSASVEIHAWGVGGGARLGPVH